MLLNDTEHFNGTQVLTFTNIGQQAISYTITHQPAGTAYAYDVGTLTYSEPPEVSSAPADVAVSAATFDIAPGKVSF